MPKTLSLKPEVRVRRMLERIVGQAIADTIPDAKLAELANVLKDNDRMRAEAKAKDDEP